MMGMAPLNIHLIAELKGEPSEEWYCLAEEWEWPDGTKSTQQSDCEPFKGETENFWSKWYQARGPGDYNFTFRLLKGKKVKAEATVQVLVR